MPAPLPDPGSFRDPLSRVLLDEQRVLRVLSPDAARDFDAVLSAPFFKREVGAGRIIATERVEGGAAELGIEGEWAEVLEHPRLDVWTYPYEWSFSMLRDAALLQLELQRDALADGMACKDATPYNVQFDGVRPVFIDVGSFERYRDGDPWYGYLQFCQLFLFPLLLQAYAEIPFQPLLRGAVNGLSPEEAWHLLGPLRLPRKGVPLHVALHARAQRRFADSKTDMKAALKKGGYKRSLIEANVKGLHGLVSRLQWKRSESTWSEYSERGHYTEHDLSAKEAFVREAVGRQRRSRAWDIGCNDGRFSRLIAGDADQVLAFDGDHLVVDVLYRALRAEGATNITPLVLDLSDPPPAIGWANQERPAFIHRCQPDFVIALAVIHHIALSANVPTAAFLDLLRSFRAAAVVEFPTEADPMVKRLLRNKRAGVHADYTLARFEAEVADRFEVRRRQELETRVLFELTPR
jgi:ribosomal protein L11 methylase PrmA